VENSVFSRLGAAGPTTGAGLPLTVVVDPCVLHDEVEMLGCFKQCTVASRGSKELNVPKTCPLLSR